MLKSVRVSFLNNDRIFSFILILKIIIFSYCLRIGMVIRDQRGDWLDYINYFLTLIFIYNILND